MIDAPIDAPQIAAVPDASLSPVLFAEGSAAVPVKPPVGKPPVKRPVKNPTVGKPVAEGKTVKRPVKGKGKTGGKAGKLPDDDEVEPVKAGSNN